MKILTRQYHTIRPNYRKLQHIHFPGISSFQHGLNIQQLLVDANLDYKSLEFKYRRIQRQRQQISTNTNDSSLLALINKLRIYNHYQQFLHLNLIMFMPEDYD